MAYQVFLEVGADGRAMAHVPALPGCVAVAPTRDEVLTATLAAIERYVGWLVDHGEAVMMQAADIELAAESCGSGPFDPGDKAALLPPDREPVRHEEMTTWFRWMRYSRDDLLGMIRNVPDEVLSESYTEGWSIDTILRHIGGAEVWYVTRIDEDWRFDGYEEHRTSDTAVGWLERTRMAAVARLSRLSATERSCVFCPSAYTHHSDEEWTARKVFRRFLEHEGEHRAQIEANLAARGA